MNAADEIREAVLTSLREQPTLNTPTLIAEHAEHLQGDTEPAAVEAVLRELVEEGLVKKRHTGWKLAPQAG